MRAARSSARLFLFSAALFLLCACSAAPYRPEPGAASAMEARAKVLTSGVFQVRASVPGEDETRAIFGLPLYERGIQPVWLEVTNRGSARARIVLASIDPDYFSPFEVAYMHRKKLSKQGWMDMERHLYANALPRHVAPGGTVRGYVFTHAGKGTKAFNVDVLETTGDQAFEQFTFFVDVPGFTPDHAEIDFRALYPESEVADLDVDGLRAYLKQIPCCTSSHDGSRDGRPVLLFFVAPGQDMLRALLRAGWSESSYRRDAAYLAGADYLFGRPPDGIFRKGRDKTTERVELGLWLLPARVDGKPLWAGQFKHAIGRRYAIGELFLGVPMDPDAPGGRDYVVQDLWYAQSVERWAGSRSGLLVPEESPRLDLHDNAWFAGDDFRTVIWISGDPVALDQVTLVEWDYVYRAPKEAR